jgi:hypothetical protein
MKIPPKSAPIPDDWRLRALAYADGELDLNERTRFETDLAENPNYAELLRDLEQTSPANGQLWAILAPPWPNPSDWERVRNNISERLANLPMPTPTRVPNRKWPIVATALAASVLLIAATAIWWATFNSNTKPGTQLAFDPLAVYDVLPIATPDDVMVHVVKGRGVEFATMEHPLPGVMPVAEAGDVVMKQPPAEYTQPTTTDAPNLTDK